MIDHRIIGSIYPYPMLYFYYRGIDIIEHVRSDGINVGEDV